MLTIDFNHYYPTTFMENVEKGGQRCTKRILKAF